MTTISVSNARAQLYKLLDLASETHEPIHITGKRSNAVLISQEDWNAITETLHLQSILGMVESIKAGMKEDFSKCSEDLSW